jgi:hypothetical protein
MSKLAKALDATLTGNAKALQSDMNHVSTFFRTKEINFDPGRVVEFALGTKLEIKAWVNENDFRTDLSNNVKHDLRRAIIEDVFGEFRPLIIEMRAAIYYDRDMNKLRDLLIKLEDQMFTEGL